MKNADANISALIISYLRFNNHCLIVLYFSNSISKIISFISGLSFIPLKVRRPARKLLFLLLVVFKEMQRLAHRRSKVAAGMAFSLYSSSSKIRIVEASWSKRRRQVSTKKKPLELSLSFHPFLKQKGIIKLDFAIR